MKKAYCLIRVEEHLPSMQEQIWSCILFAERNQLNIERFLFEYTCMDVNMAYTLHGLRDRALNRTFDTLLVCSYDCIGADKHESIFARNFFIDHGVEVHSALEGKARYN